MEIIDTHIILFLLGKVKCFYVDVVFEDKYRPIIGGLMDEENRARASVCPENTDVFATTCATGAFALPHAAQNLHPYHTSSERH